MSARPRLVEEGRPVTEIGMAITETHARDYNFRRTSKSKSNSNNNLMQDDSINSTHSTSSLNFASNIIRNPMNVHVNTAVYQQRPHKQSMRLVVGEDDPNDDVMSDLSQQGQVSVAYDDNHHQHYSNHFQVRLPVVANGAAAETEAERMEGVESLDAKGPMVVMDGANIAYAYANANTNITTQGKTTDTKGIAIAANYFLAIHVRVAIVIPAPWLQRDQLLQDLKANPSITILEAPSRDDDDSYAITVARREQTRADRRGEGGGFVLSNDMFRDAAAREEGVGEWLKQGRISYAFVDMANLDDHGDVLLDFIPNPRHALITWAEENHRRIHAGAGGY